MNHIDQQHTRTSARVHRSAGTILFLAVLGLAGCNGKGALDTGGGGGGGGGGPVAGVVQVQNVLPTSGPFVGGTQIRVTGSHFLVGEANTVLVGGRQATDVVVVDENTLSCRTPSGTAGATVEIKVQNRLGEGRLLSAYTYNPLALAQSDVNGDGIADLVVASPSDDTNGVDAGAVMVFFGTSNPIDLFSRTSAQADLTITGHHAGDAFGCDLVIGDVTGDGKPDLVVGANHLNLVTATDAGAVYVFRGPLAAAPAMSALAANARIVGESALAGDRFGTTVEIGDVDGNGTADLVVGASGHDVAGKADAGCIYLFRGGATLVSKGAEQADMAFDGDVTNERVGNTITCGDLNGDGKADLVICSQLADPIFAQSLPNAGKVYVVWGGSSLASTSLGAASAEFFGTAVEDRFGASAAVADVNDDGIADLIVGAPRADGTDTDAGKVYVFFGGPTLAGGPADAANVILQGAPTHNSFGQVVRAGDVNGDGIADLLIGAPEADYLNDDNGRSYLFLGGAGLTSEFAVSADAIFNGEVVQGEGFGSALSLVDFNNDGLAEVVCAASKHDFGAGRVYMWMGAQSGPIGSHLAAQADVMFTGLETGAQFGSQLAEGQ
jgi:hypothetical protein